MKEGIILGLLAVFMFVFTMWLAEQAHQNRTLVCSVESIPTDNQLIQVNDSLYVRINVRVDTTYFYDRKNPS